MPTESNSRTPARRLIEILFWEYQFSEPSNPSTMVRRQFLCGVNIKPGKEQEVLSFSLSGPSDVISVGYPGRQIPNFIAGECCN